MKTKKFSIAFVLIALPIVFSIVAISGFSQGSQPTSSLSQVQREQILHNITSVVLPYGLFDRAHQLGNFPADEIAYSAGNASSNSNTQEIILPYGIFVRTTPEQSKADQISDPQWATHHHFLPNDQAIIDNALSQHAKATGTIGGTVTSSTY